MWLLMTWARFLSLAQSKLRLCSANHRPGYWSNLPCDWPSTAWAYSEQETGVSSDYAQPITGQVTEVTCPVIGQAQPELTPSKRQKTGPGDTRFQGISSHDKDPVLLRYSRLSNWRLLMNQRETHSQTQTSICFPGKIFIQNFWQQFPAFFLRGWWIKLSGTIGLT